MRLIAVCLGVLCCAFATYMSNGQTTGSFDSAPNSLLAYNVLERERLDFDPFRGSYFSGLGGQYAFTEAPNGHLTSVFPVGSAIVAFPLYAGLYFANRLRGNVPVITSPAFEPQRHADEKLVAAFLAAVSVVLFLLCALLLGDPVRAGVATAVYALGTSMWTIGSQALWQHGPLNLCIVAMVYALLRSVRVHADRGIGGWLILGGLCAGFLPVIRPTALIFSAAGSVFAVWAFRLRAWPFFLAAAAGLSPGIAWNAYFFHSLVGGYVVNVGSFTARPQAIVEHLAGLLMSPSRGLVIFCPIVLFAAAGAVRVVRSHETDARLLALLAAAAAGTIGTYALYADWWGGFAYGPRFLTDIAAVTSLLILFAVPARRAEAGRGVAGRVSALAFACAFLWSVCVQFAGANSGAAGAEWNAVPESIDQASDRLWRIRDNQIVRNMRATYAKDIVWQQTLSAQYRRDLKARVLSISALPARVSRGEQIALSAVLLNAGPSRQYGYDTGVYRGQMRVCVRFVNVTGQANSEQYLYLQGSPSEGESARAIGTIRMPNAPGTYRVEFEAFALGLGPLSSGGAQLRPISVTVT